MFLRDKFLRNNALRDNLIEVAGMFHREIISVFSLNSRPVISQCAPSDVSTNWLRV